MIGRIKQHWQDFRRSKPGRRFQDSYRRRQRASNGCWDRYSILNIVLGIVIAVLGLALIPAPGPGWVVTFIGLGLLASEFEPIARALDWLEVRGRMAALRAKRFWNHASTLAKTLIVLCSLLLVSALGYGAYELVLTG